MPDNDFLRLEQALARAGKAVSYPSTPAMAIRVRAELERRPARHVAWVTRRAFFALAALVIAVALLLAFPETREALAQLLGLRTIQILPATPTPTLTVPATPAPGAHLIPPATATVPPVPSATSTGAKIQCCTTTLADAKARARFKILLPPSESPSQVYFQELSGSGSPQQLILEFGDPSSPRFTLYQATSVLYGKIVREGTVIEETRVQGQRALWLVGAPHVLIYLNARGQPQFDIERTVYSNTLAWEIGDVTYRLETDVSKEEAVRFAESLR